MGLHLIVHAGAELHGQHYSYQGGEDWESQPIDLNNLPGMGVLALLSPGKSQPTWATMNEILPVKPNYRAKRTRNTVREERAHTWSLTSSWRWRGLNYALTVFLDVGLHFVIDWSIKKGPKMPSRKSKSIFPAIY